MLPRHAYSIVIKIETNNNGPSGMMSSMHHYQQQTHAYAISSWISFAYENGLSLLRCEMRNELVIVSWMSMAHAAQRWPVHNPQQFPYTHRLHVYLIYALQIRHYVVRTIIAVAMCSNPIWSLAFIAATKTITDCVLMSSSFAIDSCLPRRVWSMVLFIYAILLTSISNCY